jgi:sugar (pentulose or hexulose) kinase
MGQGPIEGRTIVVDIGKTNAKLSLWSETGAPIRRRSRPNDRQSLSAAGYRMLDVQGIDAWLIDSVRELAADGAVARIATVGHGAAAALIRDGKLFADPMDYEVEVGPDDRADYQSQRDAFAKTGSPALPQGLNLGMQLHLLEKTLGPLPDDVVILPWPQYWAWRFSGVAASEVTSLGCHSDLWRPADGTFSELARRRGWASRMAPLRRAAEALGPVTAGFAAATGLNEDCQVLCGLHDSNAALLAARGHREIADREATVLSTGTWFVAMRSAAAGVEVDIGMLEESRDCLVNVDVHGRPTPSARFMGGREAELAGGVDSFRLTDSSPPEELLEKLPGLVEGGVFAVPGLVPGVGPFPDAGGSWRNKPSDPVELRAATDLYLALVADASLELIGSRERLLVEGRFAEDVVFVRALATLRPEQRVFTSNAEHDVAYGALRLVDPELAPASELTPVEPLDLDLGEYAARWRAEARRAQEAA